jgi:hypothetical protein
MSPLVARPPFHGRAGVCADGRSIRMNAGRPASQRARGLLLLLLLGIFFVGSFSFQRHISLHPHQSEAPGPAGTARCSRQAASILRCVDEMRRLYITHRLASAPNVPSLLVVIVFCRCVRPLASCYRRARTTCTRDDVSGCRSAGAGPEREGSVDRRRILWIIIDLDGWMDRMIDRSRQLQAGRQMVASIAGMQQYLAYI